MAGGVNDYCGLIEVNRVSADRSGGAPDEPLTRIRV
jgi:hypothetical protein